MLCSGVGAELAHGAEHDDLLLRGKRVEIVQRDGHGGRVGIVGVDDDVIPPIRPDLPGSVEKRTPIGGKLIFETFTGEDHAKYAEILLVYATAAQLRAESTLSYDNPPAGVRIKLKGLQANADGLYSLADVQQRLTKAIVAYDNL